VNDPGWARHLTGTARTYLPSGVATGRIRRPARNRSGKGGITRCRSLYVTLYARGTAKHPPSFCMAGPDSYQFLWATLERVI